MADSCGVKKLQRYLPEWAVEYGKGECSWVSNLDGEATINYTHNFYAWSLGVACGGLALLFLFEGLGEFPKIVGFVVIGILGIVGFSGCLGSLFNLGEKSSSPAEKYYKMMARLKGRERRYSSEELAEVKKYQDWLRELHRSELKEIRRGSIKWVRRWRTQKLDKDLRSRQIQFYDIFLQEAGTLQHKWVKEEDASYQQKVTPFQKLG